MAEKPKIALYWCASCGGCEESIVDLAEEILFVVDNVDIIFWPVAMDFKKIDVEKYADGEILASIINGSIRSTEHHEMVQLLRTKSKYIIAYGACAHLGGIPSLANMFSKEEILNFVYEDSPTVVQTERTRPQPIYEENGRLLEIPQLWDTVRALDQVVEVDYYLPGCPPSPKLLKNAVIALLTNNLPPKGSVLSPDIALCDECPRKETKPLDLQFTEFKRPHLVSIDPEKCFLTQGLLCMGPATRSGCEALCISGNMPCSGCYGPTSRIIDQGAKFLSSISSLISAKTDKEIDEILNGIPDPLGTFYRYGLAKSILFKKANL